MGLFSFLSKKPNSEWCVVLSNSEYGHFINHVRAAADSLFPGSTIDVEIGLVNRPEGAQISLFNLARMWKQAEPATRPELVAGFFTEIGSHTTESFSFEEAQANLRTRLYPYEPEMAGFPSCIRAIEESFLEILVIDGEKSIRSVMPDEIENWEIELEELARIARANVFAHETVSVERAQVDDLTITIVAGQNFYVAGQALELGRFVIADDSPLGVLLVIPTRSMFSFAPVIPDLLSGSIQFYQGYAQHFFTQETGGVTPDVFWWNDGQLVKLSGQDLPPALAALLDD